MRDAAERDRLADDPRIASEPARPQPVTQDRNTASARLIFIRQESAAVEKRCAEQPKEFRGDARNRDLLGLRGACEIHELEPVSRHVVEQRRLLTPDVEYLRAGKGRRNRTTDRRESNERGRVRRLQRPQQHGVRDRENRDVRADAQHERENRHRGEGRLTPQIAQRVERVL